MFELKKIYKTIILPIIVIVFCIYSFTSVNKIKYDFVEQDIKYFQKINNAFESITFESYGISQDSKNADEKKTYLSFSKKNFYLHQYLNPLIYDINLLQNETEISKYKTKTEHNFYTELSEKYEDLKSYRKKNNIDKLQGLNSLRELDPYFDLIKHEIDRYGFYTTSYNYSFWKSFSSSMKSMMTDGFVCVIFLLAIIMNEMNYKNVKLDVISKNSTKLMYTRLLKYAIFFIIAMLSLVVGNLIYSKVNGYPIGSPEDMILNYIFNPKLEATTLVNTTTIGIISKIIYTSFIIYSIFMIVYEILRRFMKFGYSLIAIIVLYVAIVIVAAKYYIPISVGQFVHLGEFSWIFPALCIALFVILCIVNKKYTKFVYYNYSKSYNKIDIKNLLQIEYAKLIRNNVYKIICISLVIAAVIGVFNGIKYKNILAKDDYKTLQYDLDVQEENVKNNPGDNSFKHMLAFYEGFSQSYKNRINDPGKYYDDLITYIDFNSLSSQSENTYAGTIRASQNRVNYFKDNNLKPDSKYTIVSGEIEPSLFSQDKFSLYKTKLRSTTEQRGLIGYVIYMYESGILPLFSIILSLVFTFEFKKEKSRGSLKLSLVNQDRDKILKTKQLSSFIASSVMYFVLIIVVMIMGLLNGGIGEKLYPIFCYQYTDGLIMEGVFKASANFLLPMILINVLIIVLVISFSNMMTTFIKNETVNVIATTVLMAIGIAISYIGTFGKFYLINPFSSMDSLMILKGGYNYLNSSGYSNPIFNVISILFYIVLFNVISRRKMKGDINA